jgi:hypothetical protein
MPEWDDFREPLPEALLERLVFLQDPWNFLAHCVFTQDEVDPRMPVKPAPIHRPYVKTVVRLWQENDRILIDKSRRMWMSWLFLALHLHLAFTQTNRRIGVVSKKFEDACAHLDNMRFIWEHMPPEVWPPDVRPKLRAKEGFLYFDEIDSVVHALASGPDQARQYGFSALFFDEMDFWEKAEATYAAATPTLQGGGKLTIVTTHNPEMAEQDESFYKRILEDRI